MVLLPRGQGKTALMALVALYHLINTERARVFCAAASREQARNLFEYAQTFARELGDPHLVERHLELRWVEDPCRPRRFTRYLRVLAADAAKLHGLTYSLAILDELQAHSKLDVYTALNSAIHKRPDAELIVISTAGQGADSPLGKLRSRALALPSVRHRGAVTDARGPDLRFLEWACGEDDDVDRPRIVKRANPASWVSVDQLRAARASLPDLAHRRFVANQWTERAGHWLPPGAWDKCIGEPQFEPGERVWAAIDVGGERSATALAWINEDRHVGCLIFHGEGGILEAAEAIRELAETYVIAECTYDPMRAVQLGAELAERGITASSYPQTDSRTIPASARLHDASVRERLVLPDDSELREHAATAIARHKPRGWRIEAPDRSSNVDGVIALMMALDRFENQPEPTKLIGWL